MSAIVIEPLNDGAARPPVPDVDALMQRVRAAVAGKLGRGEFAQVDFEALRRAEFDPHERADFGPAPADDIARLHATWDPLGPFAFVSHRGGIGSLVVAAKRLLWRVARPVAVVTLVRQSVFNGAVARLLTGASHGVQMLEADSEALARRLYDLECRNRELQARCDELQGELGALRTRLDPPGRASA